jgi:hypothetical protein
MGEGPASTRKVTLWGGTVQSHSVTFECAVPRGSGELRAKVCSRQWALGGRQYTVWEAVHCVVGSTLCGRQYTGW